MSSKPQYEPKWMKARSTSQARRAIAGFVDENTDNLSEWLQRVANGMPKVDGDGKVIVDNQGSIVWLNKPDPATAMKLVSDIAEYVLPKLSRGESTVVARIEQGELDVTTMSTDDLKRFVLRQAGVDSLDALTIDAEVVPAEAMPDWLEPK